MQDRTHLAAAYSEGALASITVFNKKIYICKVHVGQIDKINNANVPVQLFTHWPQVVVLKILIFRSRTVKDEQEPGLSRNPWALFLWVLSWAVNIVYRFPSRPFDSGFHEPFRHNHVSFEHGLWLLLGNPYICMSFCFTHTWCSTASLALQWAAFRQVFSHRLNIHLQHNIALGHVRWTIFKHVSGIADGFCRHWRQPAETKPAPLKASI